jgi:hypothetical protein
MKSGRTMQFEKFMNTKKAIWPILATLLLIVIAVLAIVGTYIWITTYIDRATAQAEVILYPKNVRFNEEASTTVRTIGNSGTEDTRILRVMLGNSSSTMIDVTSNVDEIVGVGAALNDGRIVELTINWPNDVADTWESGENSQSNYIATITLFPNNYYSLTPRNKILLGQTMNPLIYSRNSEAPAT